MLVVEDHEAAYPAASILFRERGNATRFQAE